MSNAKTIQVLNKRNNQVETAVIEGDKITVLGKELSQSTFSRWYKEVEGEAAPKKEGADNVDDKLKTGESDVDPSQEVKEGDKALEAGVEGAGEEVHRQPVKTDAEIAAEEEAAELAKLLEGGTPLQEQVSNKPAGTPETAPTNVLVYNPVLLSGYAEGTKGGKCVKVFTSVAILDKVLNITEYNGFITDVRVLSQEGEELKEVYKSPKMSIKDTLEYLGLKEEAIKVARKELVALRKEAKKNYAETPTTPSPVTA